MTDAINSYLFFFPGWYLWMMAVVAFLCGTVAVWSITDGGIFGSGYYNARFRKGVAGVLLCLCGLWPVPLLWFLIRLPGRFNKSEIEEVIDWERKAHAKRGEDYDEMQRQRRRDEDKAEYDEQERRWRAYEAEVRRHREEEQEARRRQEPDVQVGQQYFGG